MIGSLVMLISITLMYSTPFVFGGMAGVISERAGVTNIGIEGMMTIGAFAGVAGSFLSGNPWVGLLTAGVAGGLVATLHAIASVLLVGDQTVSGVAINLFAPGFALFGCRMLFDGAAMSPIVPKLPKLISSGSLPGALGNLDIDVTVLLGLICCVVLWFVLYKTKWGLRIRSVGEHPAAADTLGINVSATRFICVVISGVLAGFGGASMTLAIISQFTQTAIAGQGFIALAAVIFGKWTPHGTYGACMLFGFTQALVIMLGGGVFPIPSQILAMLPYVMTIAVLVFFVGGSVAPKADGVPYIKGSR